MRASRGLKWENKMYKPKRSIAQSAVSLDNLHTTKIEDKTSIPLVHRIDSALNC